MSILNPARAVAHASTAADNNPLLPGVWDIVYAAVALLVVVAILYFAARGLLRLVRKRRARTATSIASEGTD